MDIRRIASIKSGEDVLDFMGPVDPDYALEALKIAELTTHVMNLISTSVYQIIVSEFD